MSSYDTKHIREVKDQGHVTQLACQYYIRARKAEDKRDEVVRMNVALSEKIIRLEGILADVQEIMEIGRASL